MLTPPWSDWAARIAPKTDGESSAAPDDIAAWKSFLDERKSQTQGHPEAARICETAGLIHLALQEWQITLRDHPNHIEAMRRLALLHRDRGEWSKARQLWQTLLVIAPNDPDARRGLATLREEDDSLIGLPPHGPNALDLPSPGPNLGRTQESGTGTAHRIATTPVRSPDPLIFSDADCARFAALFSGRENLHARQWTGPDGKTGYTPIPEPFTAQVAKSHFLGAQTIGVYPIRLDGTCTFLALDLDINKTALEKATRSREWANLLREKIKALSLDLLKRLRALGLNPLFEHSGYKGRHYWIFLEQPEPAPVLHHLGRLLLAWLNPALTPDFHLEAFPKQAELKGKGFGNLIKAPLGIHRRTGHRAHLLDDTGNPIPRPFEALQTTTRHPHGQIVSLIDSLKSAVDRAKDTAPRRESNTSPDETEPPVANPPAPLRAPMRWTDADFETDHEVSHLLRHCPVLESLRRRALDERTLAHEEQLILIHTMGHLTSGPAAVNYLLEKCLDVGPEKFMKDRLKGSPTSCPTIRKRIPLITRKVPCCCDFSATPDRYPTPLLHMLGCSRTDSASTAPGTRSAAELARTLATTLRKIQDLRLEESELRQALCERLRALPERSISFEGGSCDLLEHDGIEELRWTSPGPPHPQK